MFKLYYTSFKTQEDFTKWSKQETREEEEEEEEEEQLIRLSSNNRDESTMPTL